MFYTFFSRPGNSNTAGFVYVIFCSTYYGRNIWIYNFYYYIYDKTVQQGWTKEDTVLVLCDNKGKVKSAFAPYDPYFSFEKFEGQIISLIRMAIMSDHPENLASYCGGTLNPYFRDIIEMTYMQAMTVQDIHMEGSHLCMTLRTWWINYSEKNGRVNRCGDCIDVTLRRNVAYMEPPGFSITSVYCRNCGASFDSVRQRNCPYCGTVYHMENEGFIIERLELV